MTFHQTANRAGPGNYADEGTNWLVPRVAEDGASFLLRGLLRDDRDAADSAVFSDCSHDAPPTPGFFEAAIRAGLASRPKLTCASLDVVCEDFLEDCLGPPIQGPFRADAGLAVDEELVRVVALESRLRLERARLFASLQESHGWQRLGFSRVADYTAERLGLLPRMLQGDARLVRSLDDFPNLRRAFDQRLITWTHLRLLTPFLEALPTKERAFAERRWGEIALHTTTRELEKLIQQETAAVQARTRARSSGEHVGEAANAPESAALHAGSEATADNPNHLELSTAVDGLLGVSGSLIGSTGSVGLCDAVDLEGSAARDAGSESKCVRWVIRLRRPTLRLWRAVREAAERSAGYRCTNEQVLELVAAEVASAAPLIEGDREAGPDGAQNWPREDCEALSAVGSSAQDRDDAHIERFCAWAGATEGFHFLPPRQTIAVPDHATAFVFSLESPELHDRAGDEDGRFDTLTPHLLDARLQGVGSAMQRIDFQLGTLLRTLCDRRLHHDLGFATFKLYCESRLGISSSKASALIRLERGAWQNMPGLRDAYRDGRLTFLKAVTLLPVMSEYYGSLWVERAGEVTLQRLVDEVELARDRQDEPCGRPQAPLPTGTDVRAELARRLGKLRVQMRALPVATAGTPDVALNARLTANACPEVVLLLEETLSRVRQPGEARWQAFERMMAHALDVWTDVSRHRDPVFERDGWRCAVPGCSSRSALHDHHIQFRSQGGSNRLENRLTVCVWHHQVAIHGDRSLVVRGQAPDRLFWQLGAHPGHDRPLLTLQGDRYVH